MAKNRLSVEDFYHQFHGHEHHNDPGDHVKPRWHEIDPKHREMILRLVHRRLEEKRQYPRAPLATQVEYPEGTQIGFSKDISVGGMFVELTRTIPVGTRLQVLFHLEDGGDAIQSEQTLNKSSKKTGVYLGHGKSVSFTLGSQDRTS